MFKDVVFNYKNIINGELNSIYSKGPKLLKDPIQHIIDGGKRLRPILCMLTANSFNGNEDDSLSCAISIELLHIFSLIHDDIMDDDLFRHGKKTIHNKWNIPIGILAGDAILALAFKRLNKLNNQIKEKFNSALIAICEGQALDLEYENKNIISLDEYIRMIDLKTSHIIGLCAELGAVISNLDTQQIKNMKSYGKLIGRAFQIQDDLLEATSTEKLMGKSLNSDITLNKKTFLMIKAKEKCPEKINQILLSNNKHSDEDIRLKYLDILIKEGIIKDTKIYIKNIFDSATDILKSFKLKNNYLYDYLIYIEERKC